MSGMTVGGVPVVVQNGIAYEAATNARTAMASTPSVAPASGPVLGAAALALPPPVGVLLGPTAGITSDPMVLQIQQMQQMQQLQHMQQIQVIYPLPPLCRSGPRFPVSITHGNISCCFIQPQAQMAASQQLAEQVASMRALARNSKSGGKNPEDITQRAAELALERLNRKLGSAGGGGEAADGGGDRSKRRSRSRGSSSSRSRSRGRGRRDRSRDR